MAKAKKLTKTQINSWLPEAVAKEFEVVGITRGSSRKVFPGYGEVNFKTLSVAKAKQLVKLKFPYLKKK